MVGPRGRAGPGQEASPAPDVAAAGGARPGSAGTGRRQAVGDGDPGQEAASTSRAPTDAIGCTCGSGPRSGSPHPTTPTPAARSDFAAPARSLDRPAAHPRIKLEGHAYRPWLGYSFEYDFKSRLLDVAAHPLPPPLAAVSRRTVEGRTTTASASTPRASSSSRNGRSSNREFAFDRQPGAMIFGHLLPGRRADSWYSLGIVQRQRPERLERRLEHDVAGALPVELPRTRPALLRRATSGSATSPRAPLCLRARVGNRGLYTRYSTEGGGQLDGFEPGSRVAMASINRWWSWPSSTAGSPSSRSCTGRRSPTTPRAR